MMREFSLPLCSCLKSNMQTPEKCVKSIQSEQKRHQNHVIELGWFWWARYRNAGWARYRNKNSRNIKVNWNSSRCHPENLPYKISKFWPVRLFFLRKIFWPILLLKLLVIRAALATSMVGVSIILNNSAEPGLTGSVNGLGMALAGIGR